jgi:hypothetical protein
MKTSSEIKIIFKNYVREWKNILVKFTIKKKKKMKFPVRRIIMETN